MSVYLIGCGELSGAQGQPVWVPGVQNTPPACCPEYKHEGVRFIFYLTYFGEVHAFSHAQSCLFGFHRNCLFSLRLVVSWHDKKLLENRDDLSALSGITIN